MKSPEDLHSTVKFLHDLNNVFPGHLRIFKADILDYLFVTFSTLSRVPSKLTHIPVQAAEDERRIHEFDLSGRLQEHRMGLEYPHGTSPTPS